MMAALAELCKMGLQLAGALLVANLAVRWALSRYKAEKVWERQTGALMDLLAALGEMAAVNSRWLKDTMAYRERSEEWDEEQRLQYQSGKKKVEAVAVIAAVILPRDVEGTIDELLKTLDAKYETWEDDLLASDAAFDKAKRELVAFGRKRLGGR